uniref:stalk domain-containing protein n=1 Tax=Ezakiella massiliensis TaxID=1852374 RepID=UPI00094EFDB3|nr:stalk domain-containing protein [Ezakiella massiliensis]
MKKKMVFSLLIFLLLYSFTSLAADKYDTVILHGDVYDPASNKSLEKYNIGIKDDKISIITLDDIVGNTIIDASGKLVIPAFIDSFQRHFGDKFDESRLFDGVVSSIYIADDNYDSFLLNNGANISYINRILLRDISNIYANKDQDQAYTDFKSKVASAISDGFAGFYIKPLTADPLDLNFIDSTFPLYLDLENINESEIIPFVSTLIETNKDRKIHLLAANNFYSIMDDLLNFASDHNNFTLGGYPFSYVNIVPANQNSNYLKNLNGNLAVNKDNKESFPFNENYYKSNNRISIAGAINQETINKIVSSPSFTSESFDRAPGKIMNTQDINTFMARLLIGSNTESLKEAISGQTKSVKDMFPAIDSPLLNKGMIQVGADADIVIIDPKVISQHSSIADVPNISSGIQTLIREGVVLINEGKIIPNTPKARWIKRTVASFDKIEDYKIDMRGKKTKDIDAISYNNRVLLPIGEICEFLGVSYEENLGIATIGDAIKLSIGNQFFSTGANKSELIDPPILINNEIYLSEKALANLFGGFYSVKTDNNLLKLKKNSKASLLEAPLQDGDINIILDAKNIIYVYLFSALLLISMILYLNLGKKNKKIERKKG